jgi:hypothetical protein
VLFLARGLKFKFCQTQAKARAKEKVGALFGFPLFYGTGTVSGVKLEIAGM